MKKLFLFTSLISLSIASLAGESFQGTNHINAFPESPARMFPGTDHKAFTSPTAHGTKPSLTSMVDHILGLLPNAHNLGLDDRFTEFKNNATRLVDGISSAHMSNLRDDAKKKIITCINAMQAEGDYLVTKYKTNSFWSPYTADECKEIFALKKELEAIAENINGVNSAWLACKSTASWVNNNRLKTLAIIALIPVATKTATTVGYHTYNLGFNPLKFAAGIAKWSITPGFTKPVAESATQQAMPMVNLMPTVSVAPTPIVTLPAPVQTVAQ